MRAKTSLQQVVLRSRICLLAAEGFPNNAMAHRWETSRPTGRLWRTRFNEAGPSGLSEDAPHGPAPTACRPEKSEPAWRPAAYDAARRDPLAQADPGARPGSQPCQRGADLRRAPRAPAPDRNVQAVEGHAVCGDIDGSGGRG